MSCLTQYKELLECLAHIVVIISIPVGIITFFINKKKEKTDRDLGTFDSLDDKFIEFQRICMDRPYLDIFDVPDENPIELTPAQKKEELVAYAILFAIFERAFVMYKERNFKTPGNQWEGWYEVYEEYCSRDNFVEAWEKNGFGWDTGFTDLIDKTIERVYKKDDKDPKPKQNKDSSK